MCVCVYKFITFKCLKWFIATFFCYNLSTQNSDENLKHFRYQWKSKKKHQRDKFSTLAHLKYFRNFFLQSHSGRTILSHSKISVSILSRDPLVVVRSKFFFIQYISTCYLLDFCSVICYVCTVYMYFDKSDCSALDLHRNWQNGGLLVESRVTVENNTIINSRCTIFRGWRCKLHHHHIFLQYV